MRVYHPLFPYQGIAPENVYCAADDMGVEIGVGYINYFSQPHLFPDRPINMFLQLEGQPVARYMLLGALLARAQQLRDQTPYAKARLYTEVGVEDTRTCDFYLRNGFVLDDAEDMVRLEIPEGGGKVPMSYTVANVPLTNEYEQNAFLQRLNMNRIAPLNLGFLDVCRQKPHFLAMGIFQNGIPAGELLMTGESYRSDLIAMYIQPAYRKLGLGKGLLGRSMALLREEGVSQVNALVLRRSIPQCALAHSFDAKFLKTTALYPGINLD